VGKALLSRGHVASLEEAFERFIGDGRPAFVPKSRMDPERGFTLLRRFGAVPVWAHPALIDHRRHLPAFIELGLAGLEVDHPKQDLHERAALRAVCRSMISSPRAAAIFTASGRPIAVWARTASAPPP